MYILYCINEEVVVYLKAIINCKYKFLHFGRLMDLAVLILAIIKAGTLRGASCKASLQAPSTQVKYRCGHIRERNLVGVPSEHMYNKYSEWSN